MWAGTIEKLLFLKNFYVHIFPELIQTVRVLNSFTVQLVFFLKPVQPVSPNIV